MNSELYDSDSEEIQNQLSHIFRRSDSEADYAESDFLGPAGLTLGEEIDAMWYYLSHPGDPDGFHWDPASGEAHIDALGRFLRDTGLEWTPSGRSPAWERILAARHNTGDTDSGPSDIEDCLITGMETPQDTVPVCPLIVAMSGFH